MSQSPYRNQAILTLGVFFGYVILIITLPYLIPSPEGVINAASLQGYNSPLASLTAQAWTLISIVICAVFARRWGYLGTKEEVADSEGSENDPQTGRLSWIEIGLVFLLFAAAYFPVFLARHGAYIEDNYFISVLQRMDQGQAIYRDFGFFYGPLMIYPAYAWTSLFGYSMVSYFGYLAVLQGVTFAILIGVLQKFIPARGWRYLVFILLLPIFFDTLFGLNWNALRRLVPLLIALLIAVRPYQLSTVLWASVIAGLHMAYSHDYAVGGIAAILGVYGVAFLRGEGWSAVRDAVSISAGSFLVWAATVFLLLGSDFVAYIEHAIEIVSNFSTGLGAMLFHWTANSLALFGLLAMAVVVIGGGIFSRRSARLSSGDRLLLFGVFYALVVLKSGLNRADVWHINAPFIIILFAYLLPLPSRVFPLGKGARAIAFALFGIISFTYFVGIWPTLNMHLRSYKAGFDEVVSGKAPKAPDFPLEAHSIEFERTYPRESISNLAEILSSERYIHREVYFYADAWSLSPKVGRTRTTYGISDEMQFARDSDYLERHPDAVVIMPKSHYEFVYGLIRPEDLSSDPRLNTSKVRLAQRFLSTVHLASITYEKELKAKRWKAFAGDKIRANYVLESDLGSQVLLIQSNESVLALPEITSPATDK